jgi:hypothetical protein
VTRLDDQHFDRAGCTRRTGDCHELRVHQLGGTRVDDFHAHRPFDRPQREQARLENPREASVDPDQRPLVVLEVDDDRLVTELSGLHDEVEVLVHQPRIPRRDDLRLVLQKRVEVPVHTRPQHARQLSFAEEQTALVRVNLVTMKHV